jgi:hypothetical protein
MDKTIKDVSENDFFAALDNALEDADRKFVQPLKEGEFTAKTVSIRKNISIHHAEKLIEQMVKDNILFQGMTGQHFVALQPADNP